MDTAYWLTRACWYLTLLLAILGILLSAQQVTVLNFLGEIPDFDEENAEAIVDHYLPLLVTGARHQANQPEAQSRKIYSGTSTPNKRMVFVWQCPIMFMSYSASLFLLGLTILVITPLIRLSENGWTGDATVRTKENGLCGKKPLTNFRWQLFIWALALHLLSSSSSVHSGSTITLISTLIPLSARTQRPNERLWTSIDPKFQGKRDCNVPTRLKGELIRSRLASIRPRIRCNL